jgi:hypothetical protein
VCSPFDTGTEKLPHAGINHTVGDFPGNAWRVIKCGGFGNMPWGYVVAIMKELKHYE